MQGSGPRLFHITLLVFAAQALALSPPELPSACQTGAQALKAWHIDEAGNAFEQCLREQPQLPEARFNLGLVRLQQGRPTDAADQFTQALKLKPSLRGAELFLGMANYRLARYDDAVAALKKALAQEPESPEAAMWLGMSELATGNPAAAVEHLQQASDAKPKNVDILYHLGRAYMQLSKQTYERIYQIEPGSWRIHQILAESFEQADRLDDAVKECQAAIADRPNEPGLHAQLGDIYWKGNHLEQAEAEFQNELKLQPQDFSTIYKLATISIERSKPQVAQELLIRVLQAHPESREAHYQLGRAESQLDEKEPAIRDFSAAVNGAGPADPEIVRQSYYQLAQLYRKSKRPEEAKTALDAFLRLKQEADTQRDQKLQDKLKRTNETQPN
jgi:tetratricopeptide (TPR) repeat protein